MLTVVYACCRHDSPFDPVKLKKDRKRTRKHPKLGIRLKSRRSIDMAIGTPIPPGPGTYVLPSEFGKPPIVKAQVGLLRSAVLLHASVRR